MDRIADIRLCSWTKQIEALALEHFVGRLEEEAGDTQVFEGEAKLFTRVVPVLDWELLKTLDDLHCQVGVVLTEERVPCGQIPYLFSPEHVDFLSVSRDLNHGLL